MIPAPSIRRITTCIALLGAATLSGAYTPPSTVVSALNKYRSYSELTTAAGSMDIDKYTWNMTTWQMSHGGFSKAEAANYVAPWDGKAALSSWTASDGTPLGTYDNNATVQEMRLLATRYAATSSDTMKTRFKASFTKAVAFILNSKLANGGWPQVYPKRGNYSDLATYNDNAMIRLMLLVQDMVNQAAPFNTDIVSSSDRTKLQAALTAAVNFAVKAQIVNKGKPTVWCAQHDPSTYAPAPARAYELSSKSGSESIGIAYFLMAWPDQSSTIQAAVKGAIAWYKANRVPDMVFSSGVFSASTGKNMWYRFYDVDSDSFFFCDRDGIKQRDFSLISLERQTGYQWAGDYGSTLLGMESAYLTALGTTAITAPRAGASSLSLRVLSDRILATVDQSGEYRTRLLDARGTTISSSRTNASHGAIEIPLPAGEQARGPLFLQVTNPEGITFAAQRMIRP